MVIDEEFEECTTIEVELDSEVSEIQVLINGELIYEDDITDGDVILFSAALPDEESGPGRSRWEFDPENLPDNGEDYRD